MDLKRYFRGPVLWVVAIGLLVILVTWGVNSDGAVEPVDTSEIVQRIDANQVKSAKIVDKDQRIEVTLTSGRKLQASWVGGQGHELQRQLQQKFQAKQLPGGYDVEVAKPSFILNLLFSLLPIIIVVLIFLFIMNQMQGGGSRVMNFGKSRAKLITKDTPKTTFADVAGADEAIEELEEIKDFLQAPAKFQAIGAAGPRGGR
jgi:cell division protease FtsH